MPSETLFHPTNGHSGLERARTGALRRRFAVLAAVLLAATCTTAVAQTVQLPPTLKIDQSTSDAVDLSWTAPIPAISGVVGYRLRISHDADADGPAWSQTVDLGLQTNYRFLQKQGSTGQYAFNFRNGEYWGSKGTGHAPGGCTTYDFRVAALVQGPNGLVEATSSLPWRSGTPYSEMTRSSCACWFVDVPQDDPKVDQRGRVIWPAGINPKVTPTDPGNCAAGLDFTWTTQEDRCRIVRYMLSARVEGAATGTVVSIDPRTEVSGGKDKPFSYHSTAFQEGVPYRFDLLQWNSAGDTSGQGSGTQFMCAPNRWSLKAAATGKFVSADLNTKVATANRDAVRDWETFVLTPNPDGSVSLLATANKRFLTVANNMYLAVKDAPGLPGASEKFIRMNQPDGSIRLRTASGMYLRVNLATQVVELKGAPATPADMMASSFFLAKLP